MQKLTKFKVIFDLFTVCVYFTQQQNENPDHIYTELTFINPLSVYYKKIVCLCRLLKYLKTL